MASKPRGRDRREKPDLRPGRGWGCFEHPRLPVQPPHAQGGGRDTGVRDSAGDARARPPVRDDGVHGPARRGRPRKVPGNGGGLRAGDERAGQDGEGGAARRVSPFERLECPQFPVVEDRHWRPAEEGAAVAAEARPGAELVVSTGKFDRIADQALDVLAECLTEHRIDADHLRLMQLRLSAAQTIITNRIKVDDTIYRRQQLDIMPKIIAMMREEKERLLALGETLEPS